MSKSRSLLRRCWPSAALLGPAGAILVSTLLAGGASAASDLYDAAKREGHMTLYTDQVGEINEQLISAFTAKYPGIDVDFYRGDTTQVSQRFETEAAAGRDLVDVLTSTVRRSRLTAKSLLASYRSPELANYPPDLNPADNLWSVYSINLTSFAWNTKLIPAGQEPKSWDDLLDPKWKGKIGMQDPLLGGGVASWAATMYATWGEAKWTDYMTRLAAQQPRYGRYLQVQDMLGGGEIAIMVAAYPDYVESSIKAKGAPVEWAVTTPVVLTGLSVELAAKAQHPNSGKLFIDFMLSSEGQALSAKVGRLPALQSEWPKAFARLAGAKFVPSADEVEQEKMEYFRDKLKEFFGRR